MTTQMIKSNFAQNLKGLRKRENLTQKALSQLMNCSLETIRNWEQRLQIPNFDTLFQLCDLFKCDIAYLLGIMKEETYDLHAIRRLTGLSSDALKTIMHEYEKEKITDIEFSDDLYIGTHKDHSFEEDDPNEEIYESIFEEDDSEEEIIDNFYPKVYNSQYLDGLSLIAQEKELVRAIRNYLIWEREIHSIFFTQEDETVKRLLNRPDKTTKDDLSPDEKSYCFLHKIDLADDAWKTKVALSHSIWVESDEAITNLQINGRRLTDTMDLLEHTLLDDVTLQLKASKANIKLRKSK